MNSQVQKFIEKAHSNPQPLFTTLEITQACNLTCKHCYNFDRSTKPPSKPGLPLNKWLELVDDLKELGAMWINLSGGEPLLSPLLWPILERLSVNHLFSRLKTNALLLDQNSLEKLKSFGCKSIEVSLYGASEDSYIALCGREGFKKVINNLETAKQYDFDLRINLILTKTNIDELDAMIACCEQLKIPYQMSEEITSRYDGTHSSRELELDVVDMEKLLKSPHFSKFMATNPDKATQCSCAKTVLGIGYDGTVYPCIGAPLKSGDIKQESIKTIWETSSQFQWIRGLKQDDFKECQSCDFIGTCARSSGTAYTNTGNYTGCDPRFLSMARLRDQFKQK